MTLLVLSPHLDDAALDCADHLRAWRRDGMDIHVVTLFTDCGKGEPSEYARKAMEGSDAESYGRARRQEDRDAMETMDVTFTHAGLVDAGFRRAGTGELLYPSYQALTPWRIPAFEWQTVEQTKIVLAGLPIPDQVLLPLGVGGHVDHLIAREAAIQVWSGKSRIGFYVEFPYGLRPWKYRPSLVRHVMGRSLSVRSLSGWKRTMLGLYQTQFRFLFRRPPDYPEILWLPRAGD